PPGSRASPPHRFLPRRRPPPSSTLFPYTTLFRSQDGGDVGEGHCAVRADALQCAEPDQPVARADVEHVRARQRLGAREHAVADRDRKSTRLNSSHVAISYAVFCLKKKKTYKP